MMTGREFWPRLVLRGELMERRPSLRVEYTEGWRSREGEDGGAGWLSKSRYAEPVAVVASCMMITRTSRSSRSRSLCTSKALMGAGASTVPDEREKTWSWWHKASASGNRRLWVNWSSRFESSGLLEERPEEPWPWAGRPENSLPSSDMVVAVLRCGDVHSL
jgi:hypothetical protein